MPGLIAEAWQRGGPGAKGGRLPAGSPGLLRQALGGVRPVSGLGGERPELRRGVEPAGCPAEEGGERLLAPDAHATSSGARRSGRCASTCRCRAAAAAGSMSGCQFGPIATNARSRATVGLATPPGPPTS